MAAESTAEFRPNNFSLWLVPDQESASKLGAVMQEEAARFQGMPFPPHLTLLGHIGGNVQKLQEQAGQLAARLRQFPVAITQVHAGRMWLGACMVQCGLDAPLRDAAAAARRMFHEESYWPHVSILYAETTQQQREECAQAVASKLTAAGVTHFTAAALELWYTPTSSPEDILKWKQMGAWPLAVSEPQAE